jgi:enamine deaminase RidA (YjgF/YER057c/UK114 family)
MLNPLARADTPRGLVFSLGYEVEPGSRLIFLRTSDSRCTGTATGSFLEQTGASLDHVTGVAARVSADARIVKVRRLMTSGRGHRHPETRVPWRAAFGERQPASTALEVPGSALAQSLIDLESWAVAPADPDVDPVSRIPGNGLIPDAVAVRGDQRLCVAAVKPTPHPAGESAVESELLSCLDRIDAEFARHGAGRDDVVKLTVYYRDARSWPLIQAVVIGRYGRHCPVLNGVIVGNLVTPEGHVEVTGWARCDDTGAGSAYDAGATVDLADRLLVLTGTGALPIFVGGEAADMYKQLPPATIEEQAHLGMHNQRAVLESAGATFDDVFRSNWYLTDIRDWEVIEPIVESHFGRPVPVPMVVEVARLTAKPGVRFEPDLWASLPR